MLSEAKHLALPEGRPLPSALLSLSKDGEVTTPGRATLRLPVRQS